MNAQIVSFHCVLRNKLGHVLSRSYNQDVINQLEQRSPDREEGFGDPQLRGLVQGLQNVRKGERRRISIPAQEAYGFYDPQLVTEVPRSALSNGERLQVGDKVPGRVGERGPRREFRVIQIQGDSVVLDANHPLAGHDLIFEIQIVSARAARREDFEESQTDGTVPLLN